MEQSPPWLARLSLILQCLGGLRSEPASLLEPFGAVSAWPRLQQPGSRFQHFNIFLTIQDLNISTFRFSTCQHFNLEFIIQGSQGKTAKVHFATVYDEGWPVPFCRSSTGRFSKWPKHTGWRPQDLPHSESFKKCPSCFMQLDAESMVLWDGYIG